MEGADEKKKKKFELKPPSGIRLHYTYKCELEKIEKKKKDPSLHGRFSITREGNCILV